MRSRNILALVLFSATAAACIGQIGGPPLAEDREPICGVDVLPGPAPIRRMTRFEYNNTIRDLFGDTTGPANDFGAEEEALGFNNNAANLVTSSTLAEKYMRAAEGIAARATDPISKVVPCDTAINGEEVCAKEFIASFGKRAFRRPLLQEEADMFFGLYQAGRGQGDFRQGIQMVIEAALQAPEFLYRVELGGDPFEPENEDGLHEGLVHLDDWEMASRLSYFLWGTMPDEALFAAAEAGQLQTKAQVAAQARRMLDDAKAHEAVQNFHLQWLDYNRVANVSKDVQVFPGWSGSIKELMRQETQAFIESAVFEEGGDLETLLTAPYSYMNAELAAFYGIPPEKAPPGGDFQRVELDPSQRAGLVTMGSLLTINAHSNQTSPVHRGKMVREVLFCDHMPPPPANVNITVPAPDPNSTARERFAEHSKNPSCKGCHQLMDGIGFGFENYDGVGRYRTEESGKPIDATGSIIASDIDGAFDGAVELAHKLTDSDKAQDCYTKQWFRFAYGRGETKEDVCTMDALSATFAASGGNIKELLVALTQTDAFMLRHAGGAQ